MASGLQMSDILAEARPRNAELGVTGVLTAVNGAFVQIIEGPAGGIDALMAKLRRDRRHTDLKVLNQRAVMGRDFADWDMVSPRLAAAEAGKIAALLDGGSSNLDEYIAVLRQAILRQDAVLEGLESPADPSRLRGSGAVRIEPAAGDPDA